MKESEGFIFLDKDTDFKGTIETGRMVLEGSVKGDVSARDEVYLKNGSSLHGDIFTRKILVEEGSLHDGEIRMDDPRPAVEEVEEPEKAGHKEADLSGTSPVYGIPEKAESAKSSNRLW